ncbi:helix-turn-helix domain-containing protein [Roseibium sp.]|uniref:helix-turn-helix domain-containing protein n=1 Tax=Roseibium sp. TaxID=1936156 RepID=UPI003B50F6FE
MMQSGVIEIAKRKAALLNRPLYQPSFQATLVADFCHVDQLCHEVQYWDIQFQPLTALSDDGRVAHILQGTFASFELSYARFHQNLDQRGAPPPGKLTFTIPGPTMSKLWWCGKETASDSVLVYYPGVEWRSISGSDFEVYLLSINLADFARYAARFGAPDLNPYRLQTIFKVPDALLSRAQNVLCSLNSPAPQFDTLTLDCLVEDLIGCWLAQAGLHPRAAGLHTSQRVLTRILEMVDAGEIEDVRLPELCAEAGLSRRALEIAFKDRFGVGPAAFIKSWRLAQTRRQLLEADPGKITVADVMAEQGFLHVGQFATDYKRWFQELPSQTLLRSSLASS